MREVQRRQMQFGQVAIGDIWLDPKSRDDIPAVLKGLQHLHARSCSGCWRRTSAPGRTGQWAVRGWTCGGSWFWGF